MRSAGTGGILSLTGPGRQSPDCLRGRRSSPAFVSQAPANRLASLGKSGE